MNTRFIFTALTILFMANEQLTASNPILDIPPNQKVINAYESGILKACEISIDKTNKVLLELIGNNGSTDSTNENENTIVDNLPRNDAEEAKNICLFISGVRSLFFDLIDGIQNYDQDALIDLRDQFIAKQTVLEKSLKGLEKIFKTNNINAQSIIFSLEYIAKLTTALPGAIEGLVEIYNKHSQNQRGEK